MQRVGLNRPGFVLILSQRSYDQGWARVMTSTLLSLNIISLTVESSGGISDVTIKCPLVGIVVCTSPTMPQCYVSILHQGSIYALQCDFQENRPSDCSCQMMFFHFFILHNRKFTFQRPVQLSWIVLSKNKSVTVSRNGILLLFSVKPVPPKVAIIQRNFQ